MTEAQAVEAIAQRWLAGWAAAQPMVPTILEGEHAETSPTWTRMTTIHTTSVQGSTGPVGSRRFERRGQIFVQIFTPTDAGASLRAQLADSVRTVLESRRISVAGDDEPLVTYAGASRESGTDGAWLQSTVTVPFVYTQLA